MDIKKNTIIDVIPSLPPTWKLSFKYSFTKFLTGWHEIIRIGDGLANSGNIQNGLLIINQNQEKIHVYANQFKDSAFIIEKKFNPIVNYTIMIEQKYLENKKFQFRIKINDKEHKNKISTNPMYHYNDIKLFFSPFKDPVGSGTIRDLNLEILPAGKYVY